MFLPEAPLLRFAPKFRNRLKGTSNNCHQSSGAPNLPTNDSALFSFRFRAVHPKDVRDCQLRQLFEVPSMRLQGEMAPQSRSPLPFTFTPFCLRCLLSRIRTFTVLPLHLVRHVRSCPIANKMVRRGE